MSNESTLSLQADLRQAATSAAAVLALFTWLMPGVTGQENQGGFEPAEISIGEPIALPFSPHPKDASAAAAAAVAPSSAARAPSESQPQGVPGSGWLGLSVAESNVPGRWRVDEVVAGGPAAKAGMLAGDELRAINGVRLESAEDVSAALATIAAGQEVRVAVARGDTMGDVVLRAESRPAPTVPVTSLPQQALPQQAAAAQALPGQAAPPAWQRVGERREPSAPAVASPAAATAPTTSLPPPFVAAPSVSEVAPHEVAPARESASAGESGLQGQRGRTALGVRTVPIDPTLQARFSLPEPAGAYVIGVVQDLPASRAGVPPGSVIVALDDRPVRSPEELTRLVTTSPVDRPVTVQFVLPGGASKRADVVLQPLSAPLEQAFTGGPVPTSVPTLEPGPVPQRVERVGEEDAAGSILDEIRHLRQRLERLERRLENPRPTVRR